VIGDLEKAWTLAKEQIMEDEKLHHLQVLSQVIENASRKYKAFAEMVEMCDSDIFITIPCLAILRGLIYEEDKGICRRFLPEMFKEGEEIHKKYMELKAEYLKLKTKVCGNTEFIIRTGGSGSGHGTR
jgi:hypothetical protein